PSVQRHPRPTPFPYTTLFRSARAMLTAGLDRLAKRGASRLKVCYGTDVARGLYVGAGFRLTSTSRPHSWRRRVATSGAGVRDVRSEEHTSELQSRGHLVCRLL